MAKKFRFSWKISITGSVLALCMLSLAYWQWTRHIEKKEIIAKIDKRLELPIVPISTIYKNIVNNPADYLHRKVELNGEYDFSKEIIIKNRRYDSDPGVIIITPLKLSDTSGYVLVNRGFVPLKESSVEKRKKYQNTKVVKFVGLIKESNPRKFLAPKDPETSKDKWNDAFYRIDIEHLQTQYPYKLANFYVERMSDLDSETVKKSVIKTDSDKEELLLLPLRGIKAQERKKKKTSVTYPVPLYTTVLPAGRHLGYVFEWSIMALMTATICFILQLKRPKLN